MRAQRKIVFALIIFLLCFAGSTYATDGSATIDVVDGVLIVAGQRLELGDVEKPIKVRMENGEVILDVTTKLGTETVNLGSKQIAMTERASQYAQVVQSTTENSGATGTCPACGKSMSSGDHTKLRCGHYACKAGANHLAICKSCGRYTCNNVDHTPCPGCGVGMCAHNDLTCDYTRNPAPTPFHTKNAEGKTVYYYISPDGTYVMGYPTSSPWVWAPAKEYLDAKATPTPSPSPTPFW